MQVRGQITIQLAQAMLYKVGRRSHTDEFEAMS